MEWYLFENGTMVMLSHVILTEEHPKEYYRQDQFRVIFTGGLTMEFDKKEMSDFQKSLMAYKTAQ